MPNKGSQCIYLGVFISVKQSIKVYEILCHTFVSSSLRMQPVRHLVVRLSGNARAAMQIGSGVQVG